MNNLEQWMAPKEVGSSLSPDANGILMYEPKGVTLILGPWNYPFMLTMAPLAASLAAGNSAIVKLSDFTMNTSNIAAKVIRDAFDEKEVAIFEGELRWQPNYLISRSTIFSSLEAQMSGKSS